MGRKKSTITKLLKQWLALRKKKRKKRRLDRKKQKIIYNKQKKIVKQSTNKPITKQPKNYHKNYESRVILDHEYGEVMSQMIDIYEPDGEDWMGFKLSRDNFYTFHHINESRNNGPKVVGNGAILTKNGHSFLNFLDLKCRSAYEDYQNIFRRINLSRKKPDDELLEDIYGMMLDIFYYNDYHIDNDILDKYEEYTYCK